MEKFGLWRGLTTQVVVFVILPITLVLILISFGSLNLHRDAMRIMVGESDRRTVRSSTNSMTGQLNNKLIALRGLSNQLINEEISKEYLNSAFLLMPDIDIGIAFSSQNGNLLNVSKDLEILVANNESLNVEIKYLMENYSGGDYFSKPLLINNEYVGIVAVQETQNMSITIGVYSITKLADQALFSKSSLDDQSSLLLIDSFGNILFQSENIISISDPYEHPGLEEGINGESGTGYITENDIEHVFAYSPIELTNWVLIMEEPWESITSPILRYTELGSIILIPIILFALFALWLSAKQIIHPLKLLEEKAGLLEWGKYQSIHESVGGIEEIKSLQRTISHMANRIQRSQRGLKDYISAITIAQEDERKKLAREIHDESLQSVIAVNQRIQMLKPNINTPENIQHVNEIENMIASTVDGLRRFTRTLRPLFLEDLGLVPALEMLVKELKNLNIPRIAFHKSGEEIRLSDEVEIAIYRIAQEGLNNILRHSNAIDGYIKLIFDPNGVELIINDNGIGFRVPNSPSEFAPEGHFGLLGISERADLIGAEYDINSILGEGTTILIKISHIMPKH